MTVISPLSTPWTRLIRFLPSADTQPLYGDAIVDDANASDIGALAESGELTARVLDAPEGPFATSAKLLDQVVKVHTLLGPLAERDCTGFKCIGLNYRKHSE